MEYQVIKNINNGISIIKHKNKWKIWKLELEDFNQIKPNFSSGVQFDKLPAMTHRLTLTRPIAFFSLCASFKVYLPPVPC